MTFDYFILVDKNTIYDFILKIIKLDRKDKIPLFGLKKPALEMSYTLIHNGFHTLDIIQKLINREELTVQLLKSCDQMYMYCITYFYFVAKCKDQYELEHITKMIIDRENVYDVTLCTHRELIKLVNIEFENTNHRLVAYSKINTFNVEYVKEHLIIDLTKYF